MREKRTLVLVVAFILAALALRIGWGLYGAGMFGAEEARAQDCNQVASFDPTTDNQITPPFNITGNTFRLSGNVTFLGQGLPGIIITPKDEQGSPAGIVTVDQEGEFGENVLEGPGTFTLEIQTINDVEYTVNVEDCGSSPTGAPAPDETTNGPTPQPRPQPDPQPILQPKAPPLNAGGPKDGPAPKMPNGECPKEFPVEKGKGCYR